MLSRLTVLVKLPATGSRPAQAPSPPVMSCTRCTRSSEEESMTSSALRHNEKKGLTGKPLFQF